MTAESHGLPSRILLQIPLLETSFNKYLTLLQIKYGSKRICFQRVSSRSSHPTSNNADDAQRARIALLSLEEKIGTSSAAGELVFQVFGTIAHFERRLIAERTKDGIAATRAAWQAARGHDAAELSVISVSPKKLTPS